MKHSTIERKPNIMADTFVQLHKALHINDNERTVIILLALRENIIEMKAKDQTIFQKACHEIKNFNDCYKQAFPRLSKKTGAIQESDEDEDGNATGIIAGRDAEDDKSFIDGNGYSSETCNYYQIDISSSKRKRENSSYKEDDDDEDEDDDEDDDDEEEEEDEDEEEEDED